MAISIDLECIGKKWEDLSESGRLMAMKGWSKKDRSAFVTEEEAKDNLALNPYSGEIVSVALWDTNKGRGVTFYRGDVPLDGLPEKDVVGEEQHVHLYRHCVSEEQLLMRVWRKLTKQKPLQLLSYNGSCFDLPYAMIRSIANRVAVPWYMVNAKRYEDFHIDVRDVLAVYGKSTFPCSLDMLCHLIGIESPKEEGITGADVGRLWAEGPEGQKQVVLYNGRDAQQLGAAAEVLDDLGIIKLRGRDDEEESDQSEQG